jgi:uncharacterized membrane protein
VTESLALLAALCFGVTHFVSGVVSRTWNGVTVAAAAQVGGTILSLVLAAVLPTGHPTAGTLLWGSLSGIGSGVGVGILYRAMSRGPMSVVAPVSDVAGVARRRRAHEVRFCSVIRPRSLAEFGPNH